MNWFKKRALVHIEANLTWQVVRDPGSGRFIGVCRPLNLNAVGDTWGEFQEAANETMQLLFADLFRQGELAEYLRSRGWHTTTALPPKGAGVPRFDVPFELERKSRFEELVTA